MFYSMTTNSRLVPEKIVFPVPVEQKLTSAQFMNSIRETIVPHDSFALWTLGQNGFVLKTPDNLLIGIDPYLTDFSASGRTGPRTPKSRILPVFIEPEDFFVDVMLLTHSHADHADPFTLERYPHKDRTHFLAPWQTVRILREAGIREDRITMMHPLQEHTIGGTAFIGTFAEPTGTDDLSHMGFIVRLSNGKTYYNSGDTAKSDLLAHVADFHPDVMSICINGGYHNLSHYEAAEITARIKPEIVIPAHFDMMPHNVQAPHMFQYSLSLLAPEVEYRKLEYYSPSFY